MKNLRCFFNFCYQFSLNFGFMTAQPSAHNTEF